jgi:hypothetical protein
MDQHVATEHLQVIRTLMERSALYRRTLAPIMLWAGSVGCAAALGGLALGVEALPAFAAWWLGTAVVALAGAIVIARRQAVDDGEPFFSPPALRVMQALAPPLASGLLLSLGLIAFGEDHSRRLFVLANALFYGCAVHAAGFFMPRGMKLFGWLIVAAACTGVLLRPLVGAVATARPDHALMGALFGLAHLGYGVYLYATDKRKNAA